MPLFFINPWFQSILLLRSLHLEVPCFFNQLFLLQQSQVIWRYHASSTNCSYCSKARQFGGTMLLQPTVLIVAKPGNYFVVAQSNICFSEHSLSFYTVHILLSNISRVLMLYHVALIYLETYFQNWIFNMFTNIHIILLEFLVGCTGCLNTVSKHSRVLSFKYISQITLMSKKIKIGSELNFRPFFKDTLYLDMQHAYIYKN